MSQNYNKKIFLEYKDKLRSLEQKEDQCKKEIINLERGFNDLERILERFSFLDNDTRAGCNLGTIIYLEEEQNQLLGSIYRNTQSQIDDVKAELINTQKQVDICKEDFLTQQRKADAAKAESAYG